MLNVLQLYCYSFIVLIYVLIGAVELQVLPRRFYFTVRRVCIGRFFLLRGLIE